MMIKPMLCALIGLLVATCVIAKPRFRYNENSVPYDKAPAKCCTPEQWQADINQVQGIHVNVPSYDIEIVLAGHLWLDAKNDKVAVNATVVTNGVATAVRSIQDFKHNKEYVIFTEKKTCQIKPIAFPKPQQCVPEDAEFLGEEILGGSLKVNLWKAPFNSPAYNLKAYFTTTEKCIPVGNTLTGVIHVPSAMNIMMTTSMSNYKVGIKDFSIFDIPDYCHEKL